MFRCNNEPQDQQRLREVGLVLNAFKTKCYIKEEFRTELFHELCGIIGQGTMIDTTNNARTFGVTVYGVSVGEDDFIRAFLRSKATKIVSEIFTFNNDSHRAGEVEGLRSSLFLAALIPLFLLMDGRIIKYLGWVEAAAFYF